MSAAQDLAEARRRCGQVDPFLDYMPHAVLDLRAVVGWKLCYTDVGGELCAHACIGGEWMPVLTSDYRAGELFGSAKPGDPTYADLVERWKAVRQ